MKIPYEFDRCIICVERMPGDPEHVIPDAIGGRLQGHMLCNHCNHTLGSKLVASIKTDVSIRLAIEGLEPHIPQLAKKFLDKAVYSASGSDGSKIKLSRSGERLLILPSEGSQGSLILDTDEALGALAKKLRRSGIPEDQVQRYKMQFAKSDEGEPLQLPTGETFVKHHMPPIKPELPVGPLDDRFWVLVAFEYFSLVVGNHVLIPSFNPIREYILGSERPAGLKLQKYSAGEEYGPFHMLILRSIDGTLRVHIRLFRWISTVVEFGCAEYQGINPVYLEDLESQRSLFAPTHEHAASNQWIELG